MYHLCCLDGATYIRCLLKNTVKNSVKRLGINIINEDQQPQKHPRVHGAQTNKNILFTHFSLYVYCNGRSGRHIKQRFFLQSYVACALLIALSLRLLFTCF